MRLYAPLLATALTVSTLIASTAPALAWGCVAVSEDGTYGYSYNYPNRRSARQRATHLRTVRGQTPAAWLTACGVCPASTTRRAIRARPCGVSLAFLWTFIRAPFSLPAGSGTRQLPSIGPGWTTS